MDITVTASAKKGEWALTDLLGREMGCVTETELGVFRIKPHGLTCAKYQSGEIDRSGAISRCGDEMMRVMLYEAAQSMLRSTKWSWLKAWAMQIARRRGMKKAIVALARRLAVIMHRIWVDGTDFRWTRRSRSHDNAQDLT